MTITWQPPQPIEHRVFRYLDLWQIEPCWPAEVRPAADINADAVIQEMDNVGYDLLRIEDAGTWRQRMIFISRVEAAERAAWDAQWQNASSCFVRFVLPPADGRSENGRDRVLEAGVSVYRGLRRGNLIAIIGDEVDLLSAAFLTCGRCAYLVSGREIGTGSDGEPLLADCRIVRRIRSAAR